MTKESLLYQLMDHSLPESAVSELLVFADGLDLSEYQYNLLSQGLSAFLCPNVIVLQEDQASMMALIDKLTEVDVRLAQALTLGLTIGLILDFRYKAAAAVLAFGCHDTERIQPAVLHTFAQTLEAFLSLKIDHALAKAKAEAALTLFNTSSQSLREKGLLKAGTYIGFIGLCLVERLMPSLDLEMLRLHLRLECQYYGWQELLAYSERMSKAANLKSPESLKCQGAIEEWLYALEAEAQTALDQGDFEAAIREYRQLTMYFLHSKVTDDLGGA